MPIFGNLFKKKPNAEWAAVFSNSEYRTFIDQVLVAAKEFYSNPRIDENEGLIRHDGEAEVGLYNLARMWKHYAPADRPREIAIFMKSLKETNREAIDWHEAEPTLRVRLYPKGVGMDQFPSVLREHPGDLLEMLVIDGERSVRSAMEEEMEAWGKSKDELIEVGRRNVFNREHAEVERFDLNGFNVSIVAGENLFVASHVFDLARFIIADDSPHGVLLIIPARSMFAFLPVSRENVLPATTFLGAFAFQQATTMPGGISERVFWWHDGQMEPIVIPAAGPIQMRDLPARLQAALAD